MAGSVSEFRRTPKYNLRVGDRETRRRYRIPVNRDTWIEAGLALYFAAATAMAFAAGLWAAVPFFLLFLGGFGFTAASALADSYRRSPGADAHA